MVRGKFCVDKMLIVDGEAVPGGGALTISHYRTVLLSNNSILCGARSAQHSHSHQIVENIFKLPQHASDQTDISFHRSPIIL